MSSIQSFNIATFVYLVAFSIFLWFVISKGMVSRIAAIIVTVLGFVFTTSGIFLRGIEAFSTVPESERVFSISKLYTLFPVTNLYESLIFFVWSMVIIYFVLEAIYKISALGLFVTLIATGTMLFASRYAGDAEPLVPALQSNWLTAHVITSFLAYAAFAISFVGGILYLLKNKFKERGNRKSFVEFLPDLTVIDNLTYRTVLFGVIFLALGIVLGAAWANYAWGSYWSWDPKETWSLITWLFYVGFLHARYNWEWKGNRIAILAVIGFLVTIFCYLGVNFWLSGLHSYGGE